MHRHLRIALAAWLLAAPAHADEPSRDADLADEEQLDESTDAPPPPDELPAVDSPLTFRQFVDPARRSAGSIALGNTSRGGLIDPAMVPDAGEFHYILPAHLGRPTHYGTDELVELMLTTGEQVAAAFPASRLAIGNLSVFDGGRISWSRSHNSGRDVDLGFFLRDKEGADLPLETLVHIRRSGAVAEIPGATFDTERNWATVKALLTSETAKVQWIFVYAPLERMLLAHAAKLGEPQPLIDKAATIMHQPGDSAPHDDHFHVRIFCTLDDRLEGCRNTGPRRDGVPSFDREVAARALELLRGTASSDADVALQSARVLRRLQPESLDGQLLAMVPHANASARGELLELADELGVRRGVAPLVALAASDADPLVRMRAFRLVIASSEEVATQATRAMLLEPGPPLADQTPIRLAIARAKKGSVDGALMPGYIASLGDTDAQVRREAGRRISHITARPHPLDPVNATSAAQREQLVAHWKQWWRDHQNEDLATRVAAAFREANLRVKTKKGDWDRKALAEACKSRIEGLSFAASAQLATLTGKAGPAVDATPEQRYNHWRPLVRTSRKRR
ncbi:MAG: penicillin-insensitive murein endopeptidase [Deltaproteobacteria bacterium]|nr:penicillin-insensitive murein endopeptidase [Deltaproteobacteria bacterium]